jgi:pyruvate dehydrogenase E1 component
VIAATDYTSLFAEQIRPFVTGRYVVLGTDGFGRSDTREKLRALFEVDRQWVTVAALSRRWPMRGRLNAKKSPQPWSNTTLIPINPTR